MSAKGLLRSRLPQYKRAAAEEFRLAANRGLIYGYGMDEIRAATVEDAAEIAHVHVESWRSTYRGIVPDAYLNALDAEARANEWRGWILSGAAIYVAVRGGVVVGFVAGGAIRETVGTGEALANYDAELFTIYLLERYQRRGIGMDLLKKMAGRLREEGFRAMAVWVLEDNVSAGFYVGSGAVRIASKEMEIGGKWLQAVAYGWDDLAGIGADFS